MRNKEERKKQKNREEKGRKIQQLRDEQIDKRQDQDRTVDAEDEELREQVN